MLTLKHLVVYSPLLHLCTIPQTHCVIKDTATEIIFFSRKHLHCLQQCRWQQLIIDDTDYLRYFSQTQHIMRLPIESSNSHLPIFLPFFFFKQRTFIFRIQQVVFLCDTYVVSENQTKKPVLFFKRYKNSLKRQQQCRWQQVITGAACVAD